MRMLYASSDCDTVLTLCVASRQSLAGRFPSYPYKFAYLAVFYVLFQLLLGGWIFLEIAHGFLIVLYLSWLDGQLVNELFRSHPPTTLPLHACRHGNHGRNMAYELLHASATPHVCCWLLCERDENFVMSKIFSWTSGVLLLLLLLLFEIFILTMARGQ